MREMPPQTDRKQEDTLRISDLVQYLRDLAKLQADSRLGNPSLAAVLSQLASILRTRSELPLDQLSEALSNAPGTRRRKKGDTKPKRELPDNIASLSIPEVREILTWKDLTKLQLAQLGVDRFGMPRARLLRLSKDAAAESVLAAVDHESSLGIISEGARRDGEKRSS